jgi:RNase P subunit RPR2
MSKTEHIGDANPYDEINENTELSDREKDLCRAIIRKKNENSLSCSSCRHPFSWDKSTVNFISNDNEETVKLVCSNCGHIELFDAEKLLKN